MRQRLRTATPEFGSSRNRGYLQWLELRPQRKWLKGFGVRGELAFGCQGVEKAKFSSDVRQASPVSR